MHPILEANREKIAALCRRYGVRTLAVFGSVLRDDFDPQRSDVDVLVEFDPSVADRFGNFLDFKESLEQTLGYPADIFEARAIRNQRLRHHIERSKLHIYEAA